MNGPRVDTGAVFVDARPTLAGMASIRRRERKDGTVTWAVLWRDTDTGKQALRSMPTERGDAELRDFLIANGNSFVLAAQAASRLRSNSTTVDAVIAARIDQLSLPGALAERDRGAHRRRNRSRGTETGDPLRTSAAGHLIRTLAIHGQIWSWHSTGSKKPASCVRGRGPTTCGTRTSPGSTPACPWP